MVVRRISNRSRSRKPSGAFSPLHFVAINALIRSFEPVVLEAAGTRLEVPAQLLPGVRAAFAVEQQPDLADHLRAADGAVGIVVRAGFGQGVALPG